MSGPDVTPSGHPIVEGRQQLTRSWAITLPFRMARRMEDGSLVFWAPGGRLTLWLSVWGSREGAPFDRAERWITVLAGISPRATDLREDRKGSVWRYSYRLGEDAADSRAPAYYGHAVGARDHLQYAAYFDAEETAATAAAVFASLAET